MSSNQVPSDFFASYPSFDQDPAASLLDEFQRLSISQNWSKKKAAKERHRCLVAEFTGHFSSFGTKLAGWQALCAELDITPIPGSIKQCKKVCLPIRLHPTSARTPSVLDLFQDSVWANNTAG